MAVKGFLQQPIADCYPVLAVRCLNCQYDLRNLAEHRCPECGREFDPNDRSTFEPESRSVARSRVKRIIITTALLVVPLAIADYLLGPSSFGTPNGWQRSPHYAIKIAIGLTGIAVLFVQGARCVRAMSKTE